MEKFEKEVALLILDILPSSVIRYLGMDIKVVLKDLTSSFNEHKELAPRFDSLPSTIGECWEEGMTPDETVQLLIPSYTSLLTGHCSVL